MTKQAVIYAVVVLVGLAGGTGIGYWAAQSKISQANAMIDQLQTGQLQTQDDLTKANAEISKLKGDLSRSRNDTTRLNAELTRAKTELGRTQAVLKQALSQLPQSASAAPAVTAAPQRPGVSKPATPLPAGVREYTIKDGDSFWKIAANELDNGARYKEIEALNPEVAAAKNLVIGTMIKIPAK